MVVIMIRKMLYPLLCAALMMVGIVSTKAQRLVPRQKGWELSVHVPLLKEQPLISQDNFGASLSFSRNLKRGRYTYLSAIYNQQSLEYRNSQVPLRDYLLQMGYAHPLLSDKGKNIFLYLGASALVGYEQLNRGDALLPDGATLLDRSGLVYGAGIQTSIECFLLDRLILSSKVQAHYLFNSDVYRLRPMLSLGLRYQL